jgi:CHASE2 domain-containing sensor protein/signal transduction histidine kinase
MNLRLRLAIEWLAIGLFASAIVLLALLWRGTLPFDNLLYDRLSAAARPNADEKILIVAIDDPSLAALGKWPWDRATHARLIERLQTKQPRSITFDVLLSETGNAASDAALSGAMQQGPAPIFMPLHFSTPGSEGQVYDTMMPASIFVGAATAIGHANVIFDPDGIVRRASLCFQADGETARWPHLMELAYRGNRGGRSPAYRSSAACGQELLIPYAKRGGFAEISYTDLLSGDVPEDLVRGRDVIIGATATGMGDNFPTANGEEGLLSGVEIMANMLGALRRDDFIAPTSQGRTIAFSLLPLWFLMLGFLFWKPRVVLAASLLSIALILAGSAALLWNGIWLAPGAALLGVLLIYPLWGWRRLQAMSDFLGSELRALQQEGEASALPIPASRATDVVGRQSEALAGAIDHMRDLRRFVSDTLADLPDPMFVTDPEGTVTLTNDMLDDRLEGNIAGTPLSAALDQMVAPEYRTAVDHYLQSANSEAAPEFVRFNSPLDQTFVMRRSEVRSDAGLLHGHIHYLTDITDLARAEAEREEVLQLLSHDMRAPQSTIIAILDGEVDAEAKKRIERNARRTMQLAQDFVEIARMGETEFAGEDVLLADLLREVADSLWPLAGERGIKFAFGDSSNAAFVIAEPDRLFRAFGNLIDNAIKFSPDEGTVTIAIARQAPDIVVTITDSGPGIAPDILPKLFSRFATGGEHKGRVSGAGLGLTFVQAVVMRHGGTVTASNNADAGANFTVTLPEAPEA